MKLIYKGKFEDYDSLPKADLPKNAIKFDEPETIEAVSYTHLTLPTKLEV